MIPLRIDVILAGNRKVSAKMAKSSGSRREEQHFQTSEPGKDESWLWKTKT